MRVINKLLIGLVSVAFILSATPALAAIQPGTQCAKSGQVSTWKNKKYTCIALGKKLYWNNGTKIPAAPPTASSPHGTFTPRVAECSTPLKNFLIQSSKLATLSDQVIPAVVGSRLDIVAKSGLQVAYNVTECSSLFNPSHLAVYDGTTGSNIVFPQLAEGTTVATFAGANYLITGQFDAHADGGRTSLHLYDLVNQRELKLETLPEIPKGALNIGTHQYFAGMWVKGVDLYLLVVNENCQFIFQTECSAGTDYNRNSKWEILRTPLGAINLTSATHITSGLGQVDEVDNFSPSPNGQYYVFHSTTLDANNGDTLYVIDSVGTVVAQKSYSLPSVRAQEFISNDTILVDNFYNGESTQTLKLSGGALVAAPADLVFLFLIDRIL